MASFCEAHHNMQGLLDSKAFGLATEAQPQTAGPAVPQFMSACWANIFFSILGDMNMHKWLWKCITKTNVMENIKSREI